jgi:hypothetical protein
LWLIRWRGRDFDWGGRIDGTRGGVFDLAGAAGRGDVDGDGVEEVGCGGVFADDFGGLGDHVEAAGVEGGELQTVEQRVGAFGVDEVAGERVNDLGEGELDGDAILQGREGDDVAVFHKATLGDHGGTVEGVAAVEALVEVTEAGVGQGYGAARDSVGLDMAAELGLHLSSPGCVPPPGGCMGKVF